MASTTKSRQDRSTHDRLLGELVRTADARRSAHRASMPETSAVGFLPARKGTFGIDLDRSSLTEEDPVIPQATLTRRAVVGGAAAGLAAAVAAPQHVFAHDHGKGRIPVPPEPIPGGIELGPGQRIHVWAPGPPEVTLPFTGSTLQGVDVESTTIRDFSGFSAVAFHTGTATAKDGRATTSRPTCGRLKALPRSGAAPALRHVRIRLSRSLRARFGHARGSGPRLQRRDSGLGVVLDRARRGSPCAAEPRCAAGGTRDARRPRARLVPVRSGPTRFPRRSACASSGARAVRSPNGAPARRSLRTIWQRSKATSAGSLHRVVWGRRVGLRVSLRASGHRTRIRPDGPHAQRRVSLERPGSPAAVLPGNPPRGEASLA